MSAPYANNQVTIILEDIIDEESPIVSEPFI